MSFTRRTGYRLAALLLCMGWPSACQGAATEDVIREDLGELELPFSPERIAEMDAGALLRWFRFKCALNRLDAWHQYGEDEKQALIGAASLLGRVGVRGSSRMDSHRKSRTDEDEECKSAEKCGDGEKSRDRSFSDSKPWSVKRRRKRPKKSVKSPSPALLARETVATSLLSPLNGDADDTPIRQFGNQRGLALDVGLEDCDVDTLLTLVDTFVDALEKSEPYTLSKREADRLKRVLVRRADHEQLLQEQRNGNKIDTDKYLYYYPFSGALRSVRTTETTIQYKCVALLPQNACQRITRASGNKQPGTLADRARASLQQLLVYLHRVHLFGEGGGEVLLSDAVGGGLRILPPPTYDIKSSGRVPPLSPDARLIRAAKVGALWVTEKPGDPLLCMCFFYEFLRVAGRLKAGKAQIAALHLKTGVPGSIDIFDSAEKVDKTQAESLFVVGYINEAFASSHYTDTFFGVRWARCIAKFNDPGRLLSYLYSLKDTGAAKTWAAQATEEGRYAALRNPQNLILLAIAVIFCLGGTWVLLVARDIFISSWKRPRLVTTTTYPLTLREKVLNWLFMWKPDLEELEDKELHFTAAQQKAVNRLETVVGKQHEKQRFAYFYGPPGNGKTATAKHLANKLYRQGAIEVVFLPGGNISKAKTAAEAVEALESIVRAAKERWQKTGKLTLLIIDEAEKAFKNRFGKDSDPVSEAFVTRFLSLFPNGARPYITVIECSNVDPADPANLHKIDPAILSRIPKAFRFYMGYPEKEVYLTIFREALKREAQAEGVKVDGAVFQEVEAQVDKLMRLYPSARLVDSFIDTLLLAVDEKGEGASLLTVEDLMAETEKDEKAIQAHEAGLEREADVQLESI